MYLSLNEAAKEAGKSKSVIWKALKNGDMSYVEKTGAGYKIDPAELFRVFPKESENARSFSGAERSHNEERAKNAEETTARAVMRERIKSLECRVALLDDRLKEKDAIIADLRQERQNWQRQAERLLLSAPAPSPKKRGWLAFGKPSNA
ncbi:MAG: hypothetical protein ABW189_06725 [Rickettsiales bacterium]